MPNKINQISPWIDNKEFKNLNSVMKKTFLTENKETFRFEKNLKKIIKAKFITTYSNWTCGLYACMKILNLKAGDEVIVPNLTFIATINSVIMANLKPVLCEIDEDSMCMDLESFKSSITSKTKAVIPVHLYGNCCDMSELKKICKKKKIYIIEDAAQAIGSKYKNDYLGTIGDLGGISFYGNKIITTGEGGAVISKNKKNYEKLYKFKNHGRMGKGIFKHKSIGFNFMFTEMQAAIGNEQLNKLSKIIKKKKKIFDYYKKNLKGLKNIIFKDPPNNCNPVYWFSNIFTKDKVKLAMYLNAKKIQTREAFYPLNLQPCYKKTNIVKNKNKKFSVSKKIYDTCLSLPSSYNLSKREQDLVIKNIKKFYGKK